MWSRSLQPMEWTAERGSPSIRASQAEDVARIPLRRFDGLHSLEDLPRDGQVADVCF